MATDKAMVRGHITSLLSLHSLTSENHYIFLKKEELIFLLKFIIIKQYGIFLCRIHFLYSVKVTEIILS